MASMTDYLESAVCGHVLLGVDYTSPGTVYLALFTSPTSDAGDGTEVTGGSYARQALDLEEGGTGAAVLASDCTFPDMPPATLTHAAIMDAATAGNMLLHGPLTATKVVPNGAPLTFPAGDIDATFT